MHITLTGSHGFIGTHLRNHLEAGGHTVDCWDLLINKDIANFKKVFGTQVQRLFYPSFTSKLGKLNALGLHRGIYYQTDQFTNSLKINPSM